MEIIVPIDYYLPFGALRLLKGLKIPDKKM